VAVAGDSFTELGYLTDEQLFTTELAELLNTSVINLGTNSTGPLTQLSYLRDFGVADSTEQAVIVFFEGNDLWNLADEYTALMRWRDTGQRETREFRRQPSLLKKILQLVTIVRRKITKKDELEGSVDAFFDSAQGRIPVSLRYTPPGRSELSADTMQHLTFFFDEYANFGLEHGLEIWVAFVPSKRRVLHGLIDFSDTASEAMKDWQPSDLPDVIRDFAENRDIGFVDLSTILAKETADSRSLLYNSIFDTHLNERGSAVVAKELAVHLSRGVQ
jgi:hypothetical protein